MVYEDYLDPIKRKKWMTNFCCLALKRVSFIQVICQFWKIFLLYDFRRDGSI